MMPVKMLVHTGKAGQCMWVVDTTEKLEAAFLELFALLDEQGVYDNDDAKIVERARNGEVFAARDLLRNHKFNEYEGYEITNAVDPIANAPGFLPFVQTIACVDNVKKITPPAHWRKIWDSQEDDGWGNVQFWISTRDLKEDFINEAKITFGKRHVLQVVRIGSHAQVLYEKEHPK